MSEHRSRARTRLEAFYEVLLSLPGLRERIDDGSEAGPRIFPSIAPEGTREPYLTHQRISTQDVTHLGGRSQLLWERRQVQVWGKALDVAEIGELLIDELPRVPPAKFAGVPVRSVSIMDDADGAEAANDASDRHTYYVRVDVRVWYAR